MATNNVIGVLTILPPQPVDRVTVRTATVVLDGDATTVIVDPIGSVGTFPCRIGQDFSITVVDTNAFGDSSPSEPLRGVAGFETTPSWPGSPGLRFKPALALLLSVGMLDGKPPARAVESPPAAGQATLAGPYHALVDSSGQVITIGGSPGTYSVAGLALTPGAAPVPVQATVTIPAGRTPAAPSKEVGNHGGLHAEHDPP